MIEINRHIDYFDAICCLNGELPPPDIISRIPSTLLIAADGAANRLLNNGISPDIIIGDFDSIDKQLIPKDFPSEKIIFNPDQNSADFDKILNYCIENKHHKIIVIGIHGGELDHTLNNLSIFQKFADELQMFLFDAGKLGFLVSESFSIKSIPDEMISLIPFPSAVITTENLKWNLHNETLKLGVREGGRNRAISGKVSINIHSGSLLCFINFQFT